MRKKLISNTYLRDVNKYVLTIYIGDEDYYLATKKVIEMKEPFVLSNGLCIMNNGYYILELLPKNENYSMRVYFDENKKILEYYFDISLSNGLDNECKVPYYDDLYIDVTVTNNIIEILDEDELQDALNNNKISLEQYNLACETRDKLVEEIKNGTNKFMNMNLTEFLK